MGRQALLEAQKAASDGCAVASIGGRVRCRHLSRLYSLISSIRIFDSAASEEAVNALLGAMENDKAAQKIFVNACRADDPVLARVRFESGDASAADRLLLGRKDSGRKISYTHFRDAFPRLGKNVALAASAAWALRGGEIAVLDGVDSRFECLLASIAADENCRSDGALVICTTTETNLPLLMLSPAGSGCWVLDKRPDGSTGISPDGEFDLLRKVMEAKRGRRAGSRVHKRRTSDVSRIRSL